MKTLNNYLSEALIKKDSKLHKCEIEKTSDLRDAMHEVFNNYYDNNERKQLRQNIKYFNTLDHFTRVHMYIDNDQKLCYFKKFVNDLATSLYGHKFSYVDGTKEIITITNDKEVILFAGGLSVIAKDFLNYFD